MPFGSNPVTTTQGSLSTNQFPLSSVAVPGTANGNLTALEGGPISTDSNLNTTAAVVFQRKTPVVFVQASAASSGTTQNSSDLAVGHLSEVSIDLSTTAQSGTSPTIQYFWERKGADGIYYVLWQSAILTAAANTVSTSIGTGMAYNQSLGLIGRLRWVVGGSATPTYTHSINIYGK